MAAGTRDIRPYHKDQPEATVFGLGSLILKRLQHSPFATLALQGLDVLAPTQHAGNLARPRLFEIGAAVNRLRSVRMRQQR